MHHPDEEPLGLIAAMENKKNMLQMHKNRASLSYQIYKISRKECSNEFIVLEKLKRNANNMKLLMILWEGKSQWRPYIRKYAPKYFESNGTPKFKKLFLLYSITFEYLRKRFILLVTLDYKKVIHNFIFE